MNVERIESKAVRGAASAQATGLDPSQRAYREWRALRRAIRDVFKLVQRTGPLSPCPPEVERELLSRWALVSRYLADHLRLDRATAAAAIARSTRR